MGAALMKNLLSTAAKFPGWSTPLIADACLRLKVPLRVCGPACPVRHYGSVEVFLEAVRGGRMLHEQLRLADYLAKRQANPALTFRQHLREIRGAIEE
jgi:hypothetical protein